MFFGFQVLLFMEHLFLLLKDQLDFLAVFLVIRHKNTESKQVLERAYSQLLSQGVQKTVLESLRYFLWNRFCSESILGGKQCKSSNMFKSSSSMYVQKKKTPTLSWKIAKLGGFTS